MRNIKKQQHQTVRSNDEILRIKALSVYQPLRWTADVLIDWCAILVTFYVASRINTAPVYFLALLIIGNRQHALAILGHEGAHYTIHRNSKLNDVLSNIFCFWPLLITTDGYRTLHFSHHKNTGTDKDPELMHKKARAPQWDLPLNTKRILLYAIKDLFGYSLSDLLIILTFSRPKNLSRLTPVIILNLAFIVVCLTAKAWWVPLIWYGALATSFMMYFRIRLWIEHQGTYDTQRIYLNPFLAAIIAPHNIWLHWEHHRYPTVPYHKLNKARHICSQPAPLSMSELMQKLCDSPPMPSGACQPSSLQG